MAGKVAASTRHVDFGLVLKSLAVDTYCFITVWELGGLLLRLGLESGVYFFGTRGKYDRNQRNFWGSGLSKQMIPPPA